MAKRRLIVMAAVGLAAGVGAQPVPALPAASAGVQQQRLALIQSLVKAGMLDRIERPGGVARVWVRAPFYAADFRDKQRIVGVVLGYYQQLHPGTDYVAVYDVKTGKRVGRLAAAAGGLVMD